MKLSIGIVEDEKQDQDTLKAIIEKYGSEHQDIAFEFHVFSYPSEFLDTYQPIYDIIFMDINMPGYDGLETSRILREKDEDVALVFVTSLAQYAINGYSVQAFDFLVKPIKYAQFEKSFDKIVNMKRQSKEAIRITVRTKDGVYAVNESDILYVESIDHRIIYHTKDNDYVTFGSMKNVVSSLKSDCFALCNQSYLVNMNYVTSISGFTLYLNKDISLVISRPKKNSFMEEFNNFMMKRI